VCNPPAQSTVISHSSMIYSVMDMKRNFMTLLDFWVLLQGLGVL